MSLILNYNENISKKLVQEFDLKNSMAAPKVKKVVVNMGIGALRDNKDEQEKISQELGQIVGQKPSFRKTTQSIAGFGTRRGQIVGVAATLKKKKI